MKQVTVRIPDIGHERLLRLCGRYGVSGQAVFEAALAISLEDELDPDRTEMQVAIWGVARDLEESGALWGGPRPQETGDPHGGLPLRPIRGRL